MASNVDAILERYSQASGALDVWRGVTTGAGRLGAARVRDSAKRRWTVAAHRDPARGRYLVVSPVHGDNEPFRASADGYRSDTHLRIAPNEWTLLALLVFGHDGGDEGREDEELRSEAFRLVDRMVVDAQHQLLMGAADDEDEDD